MALLPLNTSGAAANFAALTGLNLKWQALTETQMLDSTIFTNSRYPLAFYLGSENYVKTVITNGDAKAAVTRYLAGGGTLVALGWFFLKAGAFIFGSGLAIVPFLRQGVVHDHHWLTDGQFLDAVAMGLITPGPVVITATFIGYLAGGWPGAVVATVAIFIPIFLGVVLPGRWFIRHRDNAQIKAFVAGATAAAAGAIAGAVVVLSRQTVHTWAAAGIAAVSLGLLLKWKVKEPYLVGAGAAAGLLLHWPW